jgi:hypothetical protein
MKELAAGLGSDRRTVLIHLRRAGVESGQSGLDEPQVLDAVCLYYAGGRRGGSLSDST